VNAMLETLLLTALLAVGDSPAGASPSPAAPPPLPARVVNRVAAVVNGEVVTLAEIEERAAGDLRRAADLPAGPARDRARVQALRGGFDAIVAERLFDGQAAGLGVDVTDPEIDQTIEDIKKRNGLDDERLSQELASQGLTREGFRKSVKRDLEAMRILQVKVRSRVKVSDEDVQNYYRQHPREFAAGEEVHVRNLFLALTPGASAAEEARVRARLEALLKRLQGGEDFARVARAESQGPSAAEGGDLGWLKRGTFQAEVEKVAFALQPGEVSEPVRTRAGFLVLKLEGRRGGGPRPLDEVKDAIRDRLTNEQLESYRAQYIAELRKDALIETRIPELTPAR